MNQQITASQVQNSIAIYTLGKMLKNYIACIKQPYERLNKEGKERQRRMQDLSCSIDSAIKPMVTFFKQNLGEEQIEDDIFFYHETVDEIFGLTEKEIKRVNTFIKKIHKDRKKQA